MVGYHLSFLGKKIIDFLNSLLKRIPILRTTYSALGQMTESLTKSDNKQKSVVLLEYPRKGIWVIGFATQKNKGLLNEKTGENLINVFEPLPHQILQVVFYLCYRKKRFDLFKYYI